MSFLALDPQLWERSREWAKPIPSLDPRLPPAGTAPPRLAIRPDPNHVARWNSVVNHIVALPSDHARPLDDAGESPLMAFANRRDGMYHCLVPVGGELCGYQIPKKERMLGHILDKHLDQRPWRCGGQCGNPTWSAIDLPSTSMSY